MANSSPSDNSRARRFVATLAVHAATPRGTFLLWLGLALLYAATAEYGRVSGDVVATYLPAWSIAQEGTADLTGVDGAFTQWLREVDGALRSDRFPGAILVSVPAYWLLGGDSPTLAPSALTAALMTATTVALMHRTLLRIVAPGFALAGALVLALGTATWTVSADAQWTHTATQLGLSLALFGLATARPWFSALGMLLSAAARPHTAIAGAVLGLGNLWRTRRLGTAVWLAVGTAAGLGLILWWTATTLGSASLLPGTYAGRGGNAAIAGGAAGTGDGAAFGWPVNVAGFLVSPERGLLVLCPFLLVCLAGLPRAWRAAPGFARDGAIAAVIYAIVQLAANNFAGGWGFYSFRLSLETLTLATPMLVLGAAAIVRRPRWGLVAAVLVGYSVAVHALGAIWYVDVDEGKVWWTTYQPAQLLADAPWRGLVALAAGAGVAWLTATLVRTDEESVPAEASVNAGSAAP